MIHGALTCAVCGVSFSQLSDSFRSRVTPAAAVKEADGVGQVVEAGTLAAGYVAHPVVQEAAVGPGTYHNFAACTRHAHHVKCP